jgi:hypothetical protein
MIWTYHILFIPLSMDEYLGYFCVLATRNNTTINTHVHIFVRTHIFICLYSDV